MRGLEPPPNNGLESKPNAYTKFRHICLFYAPSGSMKTRAAATFGPPMASPAGTSYPLSIRIDSIAIVPRTREYTTRIARPIADSAAATVKIKRAKICPIKSSK